MTSQTAPVPLAEAGDARAFGGKAARLAVAVRAGLPVPEGLALPWLLVDAVTAGDPHATAVLGAAASPLGPALAVRSSAVGEDSDVASFAGQHLSMLNIPVSRWPIPFGRFCGQRAASLRWPTVGGWAWRAASGAGVVSQEMVAAEVAGVLFHPHPTTGADEVVIEAAWGLGEAVVGGLVTPDLFRLSVEGRVLERRLGVKDLEVRAVTGGGTAKRPVADRARVFCLDDGQLAQLHRLATLCKDVFGGSQDLEWAF